MENLIIVGLGTNARHALEFVRYHNLFNVIGFAVTEEYYHDSMFKGLPVYHLENLNAECPIVDFQVFVALMWNHLNADRKHLYNHCKSLGYKMANLISPLAIIRGRIVGDNCWIHDNVIIQNDAILESNIAVMAYTLIGADTHVSSHCFFGAKSTLGGGSTVGEQCFIGINSTVFDDTTIGNKCLIGACTAVKRNMPDYSLYVTSSDNIVIKQYNETTIEDKLIFTKNVR